MSKPPPFGAPPTLEDVARAAGVSRATASRAVRGGELVSTAARTAVERAVADLGYVPNMAARSLVTRRTETIAVVVPEPDARIFSDPFFGSTIAGVADALAPTTMQFLLVMRRRNDGGARMLDYLRGDHADGVVVISHHADDRLPELLASKHLPAAFVGRPLAGDATLGYVDVDNRAGGRIAANRLADMGCQRVATVAGPQDMAAAIDRLDGWREGTAAAGLDPSVWVEADFTSEGARAAADRLIAEHPDVDGIFVASDAMAIAVIATLAAAGRRVPRDVRVVGFDNSPIAADATPPLTTITNPGRQMARSATDMVLRQLAGEPAGPSEILRPELVVRLSG